jgi:hypothetical protein
LAGQTTAQLAPDQERYHQSGNPARSGTQMPSREAAKPKQAGSTMAKMISAKASALARLAQSALSAIFQHPIWRLTKLNGKT